MLKFLIVLLISLAPVCHGDEVIRIMAANTSSGTRQSYDPGEGVRIFQGLDPDIVLIQEFNYGDNGPASIRRFVDNTFGSEFDYFREGGNEQIPNGVVSRFPIVQSGEWLDTEVGNRDFAWARIDIPGDRDLWAVSVHFLTTSQSKRNAQANALVSYVESQVPEGDYLVIGGDFNTDNFSEAALTTLSSVVDVSGRPDDQRGTTGTNASRSKPYDQVLPGSDLNSLETAVSIEGHAFDYAEGLVFDSRVFAPLSAVSPVQANDSGASGMQHMAVIRDFSISTTGDPSGPVDYPKDFSGTSTTSSISLSWSDVSSAPLPDGYLVKASANPVIASPVDGVSEGNDDDLSDGTAQVNVSAGVESLVFSALPEDTAYFFEIFPYTSGGGIDYKNDRGRPTTSVSTSPQMGSVPERPVLGSVFYPHSGGFTVTWSESPGATGYRLDVSKSPEFIGDGELELLNENFDSSNEVPVGWVNGGTARDSISSHYGSAGNCRALGVGDTLETPSVDFPAELSFYVDSSNGGEGGEGVVSYSIAGGVWRLLSVFTVSTAGNTEVVDLTQSVNLVGQEDVRFRFESSFFTWYLDDVSVSGSSPSSLVPGYDDLAVGGVGYHAVEGLEFGTAYYFRVRAENEHGSSASSGTGSETTRATGSPYSVWAEGFGIPTGDPDGDFDRDRFTNHEEYLFATDPTRAGSGAERVSIGWSDLGVEFTVRRSIAPGLTWDYLGGSTLPLGLSVLSEGSGYQEYRINSVERFGDHEVVTLSVNTASDPRFFFQVRVAP